MWGTDMTTTLTVREGTASIFFAIDHCFWSWWASMRRHAAHGLKPWSLYAKA
jgi:hypothetical protein